MIRILLSLLCWLFLWLPTSGVQAEEMSSPVAVKIKAWLGESPEKQKTEWVPTQQIPLYIEVSTNRWFTAGTKIKGIEIPDVLVKQWSTFAVNFTEQENGQTWSKQRWEMSLYPQKSGEFLVPATQVTVQVAGENNQKKNVMLETPSIPFRASLPSAELNNNKDWFAASDVKVREQWGDSENKPLKVGDSVTRTITIEANNSLSVLLPSLMEEKTVPKVSAYTDPPDLQDRQNRSEFISQRTERQTYIVQTGGDILWPDYQFWWWNTRTGVLEKVVIKGKTVQVKHTLSSWLKYYAWQLGAGGVSVLLLLVLLYWIRRYYRTRPIPIWVKFYQSLLLREWAKSRAILYRKLRVRAQYVAMTKQFKDSGQSRAVSVQGDTASRRDFIYLWRRIRMRRHRLFFSRALPDLHPSESSDY